MDPSRRHLDPGTDAGCDHAAVLGLSAGGSLEDEAHRIELVEVQLLLAADEVQHEGEQAAVGDLLEGLGLVEATALAFLNHVKDRPDGFAVLSRDSPGNSGMANMLADVGERVGSIFTAEFKKAGYDPNPAPEYAQALIGMVIFVGQWWTDNPKMSVEEVTSHLVALSWMGLRHPPRNRVEYVGPRGRRRRRRAPGNCPKWARGAEAMTRSFIQQRCAPDRTRTCDLRIRSPLLYPSELRGRVIEG